MFRFKHIYVRTCGKLDTHFHSALPDICVRLKKVMTEFRKSKTPDHLDFFLLYYGIYCTVFSVIVTHQTRIIQCLYCGNSRLNHQKSQVTETENTEITSSEIQE